MGRVRRPAPRSRVPLHRLVRSNPSLVRRWCAVAVLAGTTSMLVGRSVTEAREARVRWGATRPVLVTSRSVEQGAALAGAVTLESWPEALAPPDALSEGGAGLVAAADLDAGVPVTPSAVADAGSDLAARIEVAVPLGPGSMAFEAGQRVDLWSTVDRSLAVGPGARVVTRRVAAGAVVAARSAADHVVVAVSEDEAEAVVEALAAATVTPVVVSGGGR